MFKLILAFILCASAFALVIHNSDPYCFCPEGFQQPQNQMTCIKECKEGYSKIDGHTKCYKDCPLIDGIFEKDTSCVFEEFTREIFEGSTASQALRNCINSIGKSQCELSGNKAIAKCPQGYTTTATSCKPKNVDCVSYGLIPSLKQTECTRRGINFVTSPIMCE